MNSFIYSLFVMIELTERLHFLVGVESMRCQSFLKSTTTLDHLDKLFILNVHIFDRIQERNTFRKSFVNLL